MKLFCSAIVAALCAASISAQDHGHLNVGASGGKLVFENGHDFDPGVGYVKTLTFTNGGKYKNFYQGNITLTALHSTNAFGEIDPAAPKLGSLIVAEIASVEGPVGGAFGFWDADSTTAPAVSLATGLTNGSFRFVLSDELLGAGQSGADAYGHIHGRRFTLTKPGIYTIGFRAYDTSANGPNGGPIHTPSDVQFVRFQAGVNISKLDVQPSSSEITIGTMAGYSWQVQSAERLDNPQWQDVGDLLTGNDLFQTVMDARPSSSQRFYRAVGTPIIP